MLLLDFKNDLVDKVQLNSIKRDLLSTLIELVSAP